MDTDISIIGFGKGKGDRCPSRGGMGTLQGWSLWGRGGMKAVLQRSLEGCLSWVLCRSQIRLGTGVGIEKTHMRQPQGLQ